MLEPIVKVVTLICGRDIESGHLYEPYGIETFINFVTEEQSNTFLTQFGEFEIKIIVTKKNA